MYYMSTYIEKLEQSLKAAIFSTAKKKRKEKKGFRYETICLGNENSTTFFSVFSQVAKATL